MKVLFKPVSTTGDWSLVLGGSEGLFEARASESSRLRGEGAGIFTHQVPSLIS